MQKILGVNADINSEAVIDPTRLDVKKDVKSSLIAYAVTAQNGQLCFATDEKKLYQIIDGLLTDSGILGLTGIQGNTGIQGVTGLRGVRGDLGDTGLPGSIGSQGTTGMPGITGIMGLTGIQGMTGLFTFGGNAARYLFSGDVTATDPGAGYAKVNNAAYSSVTQFYISNTDNFGNAIANWLATFSQSTNTNKSVLTFYKVGANNYTLSYFVTSIVANSGYYTFNVTYIDGHGIFSNNDICVLDNANIGDRGITGLIGPTGIQGTTGVQGLTGIQGNTGIQGSTGLMGPTGIQGVTGLIGSTGIKGSDSSVAGATGVQGETGVQGTFSATVNEVVTFNKNPTLTPVNVTALNIDWDAGGYQYKNITSDVVLTFSNQTDGQQVTLYLKADGTTRAVTVPTCIWLGGSALGTSVVANQYNMYTFVQINGLIFASVIEGMF